MDWTVGSFIGRSSAGRRAAWRTSVEQAFDGVIPEVVTPRLSRLVMLSTVLPLLLAACSAAAPPTPTLAPTPTPEPTPAMTRATIVFGTGYDDQLTVTDPKSVFTQGVKTIAWSVTLTGPAGASSLTWLLASRSSAGSERELFRQDVPVSDPTFNQFAEQG